MGFTDWLLEGAKEGASKLGMVGLTALEQLNRPLSAVGTTLEEVGKTAGRTAGSFYTPPGEAPELGPAFDKEEKKKELIKREKVSGPLTEIATGAARTIAAPVKGFLQNQPVSEIVGRNLALRKAPSVDTAPAQMEENKSWFDKLIAARPEQRPAVIQQIKKAGGLAVTDKDRGWFEDLVSTREGDKLISELVGAAALTIDPLLLGGGIASKTARGVEAMKTVDGMAPTLLGQLAAGERTAVKLGAIPETSPSLTGAFKSWLGIGPAAAPETKIAISEMINKPIKAAQKYIDEATQNVATGVERYIDVNIPPEILDIADGVRKAVFNRSKNKDFNKVQELILNNAKTRPNAAEAYLKDVTAQIDLAENPEKVLQNISDNIINKSEWRHQRVPEMYLSTEMRAKQNIITPTDALDAPYAQLAKSLEQNDVGAVVLKNPMQLSDGAFEVLNRKGIIPKGVKPNEPLNLDQTRQILSGLESETLETLEKKKKFFKAEYDKLSKAAPKTPEAQRAAELKIFLDEAERIQGYFKALESDTAPRRAAMLSEVISQSAQTDPTGILYKIFKWKPSNTISVGRFFKNFLTPEAVDSARKYKYNPENIVRDILTDPGADSISNINKLLAEHLAFKDVPSGQILLNDPVRTVTSAGLGMGANQWRDNVLDFMYKEAGRGNSDAIRFVEESGDAPFGFTTLSREGYSDLAVADDLYAKMSDALGKIKGTQEPESILIKGIKEAMRGWKKSVLGGLMGEGYGYSLRNTTSEVLKGAQGGVNNAANMAFSTLEHFAGGADWLTKNKYKFAEKIRNLDAAGAINSIVDDVPFPVKTPKGETVDAYDLAKKYSVIDSGFFEEEVMKKGYEISPKIKIELKQNGLLENAQKQYYDLLRLTPDVDPENLKRQIFDKFYKPAKGQADYEKFSREMERAGSRATEIIPIQTPQGKLEYLWNTVTDSDTFGANTYANNSERTARLSTFAQALQDGYAPEAAARLVGDISFNYRDISDEAKILKSIVPFMTFYLKNIPLQVSQFFENPKIHRLMAEGMEIFLPSVGELEQMPEYQREQIPLAGTGVKQFTAQTQGISSLGIIPEGLKKMFGYDNKFDRMAKEHISSLLSGINPALKLAIEFGNGIDVPGSGTTPMGDTGGSYIGLDMPIQRYVGEGAQYVPGLSRNAEHALFTILPPTRKVATLASQTKDWLQGVKPPAEDLLGRPTSVPAVNTLIKYGTGLGGKIQPADAVKLRDRFDKKAVANDIRKTRYMARKYKKQFQEGRINESTFNAHKAALKKLEQELRDAYKKKKLPIISNDLQKYDNEVRAITGIDFSYLDETTETATTPQSDFMKFINFQETPTVETLGPLEEKTEKNIDNKLIQEYNKNEPPKNFETWLEGKDETMPIETGTKIKTEFLEGNAQGYTANDIQALTEKLGSWLSEYDVNGKPFSVFITDLADKYNVNPLYLVALIQKEQSAVERAEPPKPSVMKKIAGYGYTEEGVRKDAPNTFEKQLEAAAKQLRNYDSWDVIKKLSKVKLYDKTPEGGTTLTPSNVAEAKSLLYNPRWHGLENQAAILNRYAQLIGR
jgi:hypothetical protein